MSLQGLINVINTNIWVARFLPFFPTIFCLIFFFGTLLQFVTFFYLTKTKEQRLCPQKMESVFFFSSSSEFYFGMFFKLEFGRNNQMNRDRDPQNNEYKSLKKIIKGQQTQPEEIQRSLQKKFSSFMVMSNLEMLKAKFSEYYGKNFAIKYKPTYGFDEEWEGFLHGCDQTQKYSVFQNKNSLHTFIFLVVMCFNTIMIWLNTFQTFFMENSFMNYKMLAIIGILIEIAYGTIKVGTRQRKMEETIDMKLILSETHKNQIVVGYFILKSIGVNSLINIYCWYAIQTICVLIMYRRAKTIYRSFKLMDFALAYEYQVKIIDIILNQIIVAHFIAIILHQATKLGFQKTWINSIGIQSQPPIIRYIYSFYFCCTTILTVGYGDITPKNYVEIVIITFVQIFGIIAFANFINEIGYSLTAIRKANDTIEKELLVIQKMKKWYRMDEDISKRARMHIINNKAIDSQLSPEEENGVIMKLSEELRHEIAAQNSLKKVKSSIFFLLRWSSSFQKAISLRLQSITFPPGQLLYQPLGKERIYIIREGKVDVYASKRGSKRGVNNKILKTIESNLGKEVSNNAYGFTAVVSMRPVQLYAVAKRHTSGYYIEKEKFLECIHERSTDFEYFHEFKNRIDLSPCWESIEVPHLNSSKLHYNPTHAYIIKKTNKSIESRQNRKSIIRHKKKKSRLIIEDDVQSIELLNVAAPTIEETSTDKITSRKTVKSDTEGRQLSNVDSCCFINHSFQSSKEYTNYFSSNNKSKVLKSLELEFGVAKSFQERKHTRFHDALKDYREAAHQ